MNKGGMDNRGDAPKSSEKKKIEGKPGQKMKKFLLPQHKNLTYSRKGGRAEP